MAHIKKEEKELLIWLENVMMDILTNRPDLFGNPDNYMEKWLGFYDKYLELWKLNERLIVETQKLNERAKIKMREYRNSPFTSDIAKQKAREYMREYNKRPHVIEKRKKYQEELKQLRKERKEKGDEEMPIEWTKPIHETEDDYYGGGI